MRDTQGEIQARPESVPISSAVIEAIAEHKSVDPVDLDQPLYDVVDPDALDAFFAESAGSADPAGRRVEFAYDGCTVRVSGDGTIDVASTTMS